MTTERKTIVSVSLDGKVISKLDAISYRECKSRAEVIREAVDKFLDDKK